MMGCPNFLRFWASRYASIAMRRSSPTSTRSGRFSIPCTSNQSWMADRTSRAASLGVMFHLHAHDHARRYLFPDDRFHSPPPKPLAALTAAEVDVIHVVHMAQAAPTA